MDGDGWFMCKHDASVLGACWLTYSFFSEVQFVTA